jgi:hypothetical protein
MILSFEEITKILLLNNINITGCLHIGAHECEEIDFYRSLGLANEDIIWIEAIPSKVNEAMHRCIPNVYCALITDKDDEDAVLNISSNVQSSSILEFGTHLQEYPKISYVDSLHLKSITVDSFFQRNNIDASKYNFWNFDIQGVELLALKGSINSIKHAKALYLEVNEKEIYKNCAFMDEIDAFLSQYNFKRVLTFITHHGWGDALYILDA